MSLMACKGGICESDESKSIDEILINEEITFCHFIYNICSSSFDKIYSFLYHI